MYQAPHRTLALCLMEQKLFKESKQCQLLFVNKLNQQLNTEVKIVQPQAKATTETVEHMQNA